MPYDLTYYLNKRYCPDCGRHKTKLYPWRRYAPCKWCHPKTHRIYMFRERAIDPDIQLLVDEVYEEETFWVDVFWMNIASSGHNRTGINNFRYMWE